MSTMIQYMRIEGGVNKETCYDLKSLELDKRTKPLY